VRIRPGLFLTFFAVSATPLLLLGIINYWNSVRVIEPRLRREVAADAAMYAGNVSEMIIQNDAELLALARSNAVSDYLAVTRGPDLRSKGPDSSGGSDGPGGKPPTISRTSLQVDLKWAVAMLLGNRTYFLSVTLFDRDKHEQFYGERRMGAGDPLIFGARNLSHPALLPHPGVWTAPPGKALHSAISTAPLKATIASSVCVVEKDKTPELPVGAVVGELDLDSILAQTSQEITGRRQGTVDAVATEPLVLVILNHSGEILYHNNDALKHQLISDAMPSFTAISNRMIAGDSGQQSFTSPASDRFEVAFTPITPLDLSVAIGRSYSQTVVDARRLGTTGLVLALLISLAAATPLTIYFQRKARGIQQVTEGVTAIAKGELDKRIEVQSGDEIRPLADNLNLMTERLRQQLASESETRQFQSFVKLSAMLTHDLKNAIGALSLIVSNMEQHFDKREFRADAMKALSDATEKLKALVDRLSNPVSTLSGEFKRPQATDLIPIIKKAISLTVDPLAGQHEIELNFPPSLFALVERERIVKVFDNLILNALEAMGSNRGKLTIRAGQTEAGDVFFTVCDTGIGMSQRFIDERLFHPFATTKRRGVGLGLYTCREVVRANGGSIEVTSKEGVGTTFRVVLPSAAIEQRS